MMQENELIEPPVNETSQSQSPTPLADRLQGFYNQLSSNPTISGIPEFNRFREVLSDDTKRREFHQRLLSNPTVRGIPEDYDRFSSVFGPTVQQQAMGLAEGITQPMQDRYERSMEDSLDIDPPVPSPIGEPHQSLSGGISGGGAQVGQSGGGSQSSSSSDIAREVDVESLSPSQRNLAERIGVDGLIRFNDIQSERIELERELARVRREGVESEDNIRGYAPGVAYQPPVRLTPEAQARASQIRDRIAEIDNEIAEYKPEGLGSRFANYLATSANVVGDIGAGSFEMVSILAKRLDDTFGTDWQTGDVDEQFFYQVGQMIRDFTEEQFPTDPTLQDEYATKLVGGLSSFLAFAGTGSTAAGLRAASMRGVSALTRPAGVGVGERALRRESSRAATQAAVGTAAGASASAAYREAKDMEADEETARLAAELNIIPGVIQVLPVLGVLRKLHGRPVALPQTFMQSLVESAKVGGQESFVEGLGSVLTDEIAIALYDEDRESFENFLDAVIVSGPAGMASNLILGRFARVAATRPITYNVTDTPNTQMLQKEMEFRKKLADSYRELSNLREFSAEVYEQLQSIPESSDVIPLSESFTDMTGRALRPEVKIEYDPDASSDDQISQLENERRINEQYLAEAQQEGDTELIGDLQIALSEIDSMIGTLRQETGTAEESVPVSEVTDTSYMYEYEGQQGYVTTDGQQTVFITEDGNTLYELGNTNEMQEAGTTINDLGVTPVTPHPIEVKGDYSVDVGGQTYVNNLSNPMSAINFDSDGNVVSVNLDTQDGQPRTFRGSRAEAIAYQYQLRNFESDATAEQIEAITAEAEQLALEESSEQTATTEAEPTSEQVSESQEQPVSTTEGRIPPMIPKGEVGEVQGEGEASDSGDQQVEVTLTDKDIQDLLNTNRPPIQENEIRVDADEFKEHFSYTRQKFPYIPEDILAKLSANYYSVEKAYRALNLDGVPQWRRWDLPLFDKFFGHNTEYVHPGSVSRINKEFKAIAKGYKRAQTDKFKKNHKEHLEEVLKQADTPVIVTQAEFQESQRLADQYRQEAIDRAEDVKSKKQEWEARDAEIRRVYQEDILPDTELRSLILQTQEGATDQNIDSILSGIAKGVGLGEYTIEGYKKALRAVDAINRAEPGLLNDSEGVSQKEVETIAKKGVPLLAETLAKGAKPEARNTVDEIINNFYTDGLLTQNQFNHLVENFDVRNLQGEPSQPSAPKPVSTPAKPSAPAQPKTDADVLSESDMTVEERISPKSGNTYWVVKGEGTRANNELLRQVSESHEQKPTFNRNLQGWVFFNQDPTADIAAALRGGVGDGSGRGNEGSGSGEGAGGASVVRNERRRTEDARPDQSALDQSTETYVSVETQDLLRRGMEFGVPETVVEQQIEDAAMIVRAFQDKKGVFILGNAAGSGKTFVLGASIREMQQRGAKNILYVTMNNNLIGQIKRDLSAYGIDGVKFITYAKMRTMSASSYDAIIFDESHNIKNSKSAQGEAADRLIERAEFVVMSSATPFENPVEAKYLSSTGVFDKAGGFVDWAKAYGARIKRARDKNGIVIDVPYWVDATNPQHSIDARNWFWKQGIMQQREMQIPSDMTDVTFRKVEATNEFSQMYENITSAFEAVADEVSEGNPMMGGQIKGYMVNLQKRILEASKLEAGIARAQDHLDQGRSVVLFVETKAARNIPAQEILEAMEEYNQMKRNHPELERPHSQVVELAARAMVSAGYDNFHLPSTEAVITQRLGADNVAVYTGAKTDKQADDNLAQWRAKEKKVLVATMAKGGTGLSLHDTTGDRPTAQVNINLPWKATGVDQVAGRVTRYGIKSTAYVEWLFSDNIAFDRELGARVAGRMSDMGAIVKGEVPKAAQIFEGFNFDDVQTIEGRKTSKPKAKPKPKPKAKPEPAPAPSLSVDSTESLSETLFQKAVKGMKVELNEPSNREDVLRGEVRKMLKNDYLGEVFSEMVDEGSQKGMDVVEVTNKYNAIKKDLDIDAIVDRVMETREVAEPDPSRPELPGEDTSTFKIMPISEIQTSVDRFQNRENEYSQETVDSIVNDYNKGTLNLDNIPPILVWRDPTNGKMYVVGGHSRLEAFKRLGRDKIQVQELVGLTEAQAKQRGREDNALGTSETVIEQAKLVRSWREEGMTKSDINEKARNLFKKNAKTVIAISALNPNGKVVQSLQALEGNESGDRTKMEGFAKWIGEARLAHDQLTDSHETELFNYLLENDNSNTKSQASFLGFVSSVVDRKSTFGKMEEGPLNLKGIRQKSDLEVEQERALSEAEKDFNEADKAYRAKVREIEQRRADGEDLNEVTVKKSLDRLSDKMRAAQRRLIEQKQIVDKTKAGARDQGSLFSLRRTEPAPALTQTQKEHKAMVTDAVKEVTSNWADDSFVNVIDSVDQLPAALQVKVAQHEGNRNEIVGAYYDGQVYLIAENIRSKEDAVATLMHETIGHYGFRNFVRAMSYNNQDFQGRLDSILDSVYNSFKNDPLFQKIKQTYGLDFRVESDRHLAADEFIAKTSEGNLSDSFWDRIVRLFNDVMRSMGVSRKMSRGELKDLIRDSKILVEKGVAATFTVDGRSVGYEMFSQYSNRLFESNAALALQRITQEKATPDQWVKMISDNGGRGTAQELNWVGLKDFLTDYAKENNTKSIPKEVVEQYILDNRINIERVQLSDPEVENLGDLETELMELGYEFDQGMDGELAIFDITGEPVEFDSLPENAQDLAQRIGAVLDTDSNEGSLYGDIVVPGGKNYREILLTLTDRGQENRIEAYKNQLERIEIDLEGVLDQMREAGLPRGASSGEISMFERGMWQSREIVDLEKQLSEVRNNRAYNRISSGIDAIKDNQRSLGQERNRLINAREAINRELYHLLNEPKALFKTNHFSDFNNILAHTRVDDRVINGERVLFLNEIQSDWAQQGRRHGFGSDRGYVSDMPYKQTDQWVGMAFRRMLLEAVEGGYDRVAWITGEQAAEFYDLSKQVQKVVYFTHNNNLEAYDQQDNRVIRKTVQPDKVEDYIGKEAAERLFESEPFRVSEDIVMHQISGEQLQVGGEGMKSFYNNIVPKVARKEAQRFDKKAKVEVVEMPGIEYINENTGVVEEFAPSKQLSIPITPKMRESLQQGVPLFKLESLSPAQKSNQQQLEDQRKRLESVRRKRKAKLRELEGRLVSESKDLFGATTQQLSTNQDSLFDVDIDPSQIQVAMRPFDMEIEAIQAQIKRLENERDRLDPGNEPMLFSARKKDGIGPEFYRKAEALNEAASKGDISATEAAAKALAEEAVYSGIRSHQEFYKVATDRPSAARQISGKVLMKGWRDALSEQAVEDVLRQTLTDRPLPVISDWQAVLRRAIQDRHIFIKKRQGAAESQYNDPEFFRGENEDRNVYLSMSLLPGAIKAEFDAHLDMNNSHSTIYKINKAVADKGFESADWGRYAELWAQANEMENAGRTAEAQRFRDEATQEIRKDPLQMYLMAKHAPEYNALFFERNEESINEATEYLSALEKKRDALKSLKNPSTDQKNQLKATQDEIQRTKDSIEFMTYSSGISDAQAREWLDELKDMGMTEDLNEVAQMVWDFSRQTLEKAVETELTSQDDADRMLERYEFYVPFNRVMTDYYNNIIGLDATTTPNESGGGVSTPALKSRTGSNREVRHIISSVYENYASTVVTGHKNQVKQSMAAWMREELSRGNELLGKVVPLKIAPDNAMRFREVVTQTSMDEAGNIDVTQKAVTKAIVFNDPDIKRAMMSLDSDAELSAVIHALNVMGNSVRPFVNYLRFARTSGSISFWASNPIRDYQTIMTNTVGMLGPKEAAQMARDYFFVSKDGTGELAEAKKRMFAIHKAIWEVERTGKATNSIGRDYLELKELGGTTGFYQLKDHAQILQEMEKLHQDIMNRSTLSGRALSPATQARQLRDMLRVVELINTTMENASRLAAFRAAKESGMSQREAAMYSLDANTNFNRHGEYGVLFKVYYQFANAAGQGYTAMFRAIKNNPKTMTAVVGSMIAIGFLQAMWNDFMDDERYEKDKKTKEWKYQTNSVIYLPWLENGEIKFPWGFGYSVFPTIGGNLYDYMKGYKDEEDFARSTATAIANAFNPFRGAAMFQDGYSFIHALTPTPLELAVEPIINRSFTGRIYPEYMLFQQSMDGRPGFAAASPYVNSVSDYASRLLHKYSNGIIDINPHTIDYVAGYIGGSMAADFKGLGSAISWDQARKDGIVIHTTPDGEEIRFRPNQVPALKRLFDVIDRDRLAYSHIWHQLTEESQDLSYDSDEMNTLLENISKNYMVLKDNEAFEEERLTQIDNAVNRMIRTSVVSQETTMAESFFRENGYLGRENKEERMAYYDQRNRQTRRIPYFDGGQLRWRQTTMNPFNDTTIEIIENNFELPRFNRD